MREVDTERSAEMYKAAKKFLKKLCGSLGISNSSITKSRPGFNSITPKQETLFCSIQECQIWAVRKKTEKLSIEKLYQ